MWKQQAIQATNAISMGLSRLRRRMITTMQHVPQPCLLCSDGGGGADGLCDGCRADQPRQPGLHCPVCALPLARAEICGRCLRDRPAYDRVIAAFQYAFPVDVMIRRLKFSGALPLAHTLGSQLWQATRERPQPDLLLPMPLAAPRMRQRGFNQATEIARPLATMRGLRLEPDLCTRVRDTPAQSGLSLTARRANLRGAFHCSARVLGAAVVVIDDVMTSGATLHALAHQLKAAGAHSVECWVVARTAPRALSALPSAVEAR